MLASNQRCTRKKTAQDPLPYKYCFAHIQSDKARQDRSYMKLPVTYNSPCIQYCSGRTSQRLSSKRAKCIVCYLCTLAMACTRRLPIAGRRPLYIRPGTRKQQMTWQPVSKSMQRSYHSHHCLQDRDRLLRTKKANIQNV